MATQYIRRGTALAPNQTSKPIANPIYVDSDTDEIKYGTGNSGTIEKTVVDLAAAQALTNKTLTSPVLKPAVSIVTTSQTLVAADSGKIFVANAADLVFTLPATVAGLQYTFVNAALSAGVGLSVSPAAADAINEGVDNKDLINSGATDVLGDSVTLIGDGSTGWYTTSKIGTWAAEA